MCGGGGLGKVFTNPVSPFAGAIPGTDPISSHFVSKLPSQTQQRIMGPGVPKAIGMPNGDPQTTTPLSYDQAFSRAQSALKAKAQQPVAQSSIASTMSGFVPDTYTQNQTQNQNGAYGQQTQPSSQQLIN